MRSLFFGILLIVLLGVGSIVYENAIKHPFQQIACPLDAEVCPDGTAVSRTGPSCTFPECPPPNTTLQTGSVTLAFAVPEGFASTTPPSDAGVGAYMAVTASSTATANIFIREYPITASSSPSQVIAETALSGTSGKPVPVTSLSSVTMSDRQYTVASIERFEGIVDTAYYLKHGSVMIRFDAVDTGATRWSDPSLDVATLPAHAALVKLLAHLQLL